MTEPRKAYWWHIIWTTFQSWPPHDQRGNWQGLAEFYRRLQDTTGALPQSHLLPDSWRNQPSPTTQVILPPKAHAQVVADIRELAASPGDRVAGDFPVLAISVTDTCVQLVCRCPKDVLHQKIGRIKSRSATLLSFKRELGVGGASTWGKGFWWAQLPNDDIAEAVATFVIKQNST